MRIATRRPLYWDDFFLVIGIACLTAATGLLYSNISYYDIVRALLLDPERRTTMPSADLEDLLSNVFRKEDATAALLWTTIFCVKASFLVTLRQLMQRLPWINIYFSVVTTVTGVSWVILVCSPYIACHSFGLESGR